MRDVWIAHHKFIFMLTDLQETIRLLYANLESEQQARIIGTLFVLLALLLLRLLALRVIHRRLQHNPRALYNWRKATEYVLAFVGVLLIGRLWLDGIQSLATYLGLLSAGLAIALQDLVVNFAGWLFIVWRRPFIVGERIQIGQLMGDVIDIRIFQFSMLEVGGDRVYAEQNTGRLIHVPNGILFKEAVINTHQGLPYIWNEIGVAITFESNWRKAKQLLTEIIGRLAPDVSEAARQYVRRVEKRFVIQYGNVAPAVYTSVFDSGVLLTLRYMVDPRQQRGSEQIIWEAILDAFAEHWDIEFAYPTQREYLRFHERTPAPDPQEAPTIVARAVRPQRSQQRDEKQDDK